MVVLFPMNLQATEISFCFQSELLDPSERSHAGSLFTDDEQNNMSAHEVIMHSFGHTIMPSLFMTSHWHGLPNT